MRVWLIALLAIGAIAASVLYASETQRTAAQENFSEAETGNDLLVDMFEQDHRVADFLAGRREGFATAFFLERRSLGRDFAKARELSADDVQEIAALNRQLSASNRWHRAADRAVREARSDPAAATALHLGAMDRFLDRFVQANAVYRARLAEVRQNEQHRAALVPVYLVIGLGLLFGAIVFFLVRRQRQIESGRSRQREEQAATDAAIIESKTRFAEALQVAQDQPEAHRLLKRHLESRIPESSVVVLNRNNSADRLEPSEKLPADHPLAKPLAHAAPRSCLAVRLSRHYERGGPEAEAEVLTCELCGALSTPSSCQPLLVGGEVIGSVLVEHRGPLRPDQSRQFDDSVTQAAPVLANLRNLAIAETQAATDALTGLPNKRALDDTFKRMLAVAGRGISPLSILILDLDHFKQINDTLGHERGDEALASLGALLRRQLRGGDFAARFGGEEFVALLPDTDRSGALSVAEALRRAIHELKVGGLNRPLTASFGVATYPDDGVDPEQLMRTADRALYVAKQGGRDRVETVSKAGTSGNGERPAKAKGEAPDPLAPQQAN
jgi:diguanylate cyclase (GGDEF)-like protein